MLISPSKFLRIYFAASRNSNSRWYCIQFIRSTSVSTYITALEGGDRITHIVVNFDNFFRGIHIYFFPYPTLANVVKKITSRSL